MLTVSSRPRPSNADSSFEVETDTDYLRIAKKGGGHKGWLKQCSCHQITKYCMDAGDLTPSQLCTKISYQLIVIFEEIMHYCHIDSLYL